MKSPDVNLECECSNVNSLIIDIETLRYELYDMEINQKDIESPKYLELSRSLRVKSARLDAIAAMHGEYIPNA